MSTFLKVIQKYYFIENPFGQLVIYLITGLFLIALACLLKHLWRYKRKEETALAGIKANASHVEHNPSPATKCDALLSGVDRTSLAADRVNAIYEIVSQGHPADQEQLASVTNEKEGSRLGILTISYITRSLILLGLLGTFLGLTMVALRFDSLLIQVDTSTVANLLGSMAKTTANIRKTTEGLITAFSTTLWGLSGTIILAFSVLFLEHSRQKFLAHLEDFTALVLLPIFNPRLLPEAIENSSKQLATSAIEIRNTIADLKTSAETTLQSVTGLDSIVNSFQATAVSFQGSAEMINTAQLQVNQTVADLSAKVAAADNHDASLFNHVQQILNQLGAQQQQLVSLLARLQASETTVEKIVDNSLKTISNQQASFLEKISGFVTKHNETLQEMAKHKDSFNEFIKNMQKQNTELLEHIKTWNQEIGLLDLLKAVRQMLDTQQAYMKSMREASKRYEIKIRNIKPQSVPPPPPPTIFGRLRDLFAKNA